MFSPKHSSHTEYYTKHKQKWNENTSMMSQCWFATLFHIVKLQMWKCQSCEISQKLFFIKKKIKFWGKTIVRKNIPNNLKLHKPQNTLQNGELHIE